MKKERLTAVADSYIVRIYRRDQNNPEGMVGLVEAVGTEGVKKFGSGDELLRLISRRTGDRKGDKYGGGKT